MISVKVDARKALKDLKTFRARALPFAIRNSLNRSAFHAREEWQSEIRNSFVNRNQYTERSIRVERAEGRDPSGMVARVGSITTYLGDQERGAVVRGRGKHKPIPSAVAAGQAPGAKRTKLVRAANKLSALQVQRAPKGRDRKQRNAIALSMAKRRGQRAVLLERPSGGKAIYKLMGGRKKVRTRLLWDLSRSSVTVKPEPTLQRTLKRIQPKLEAIHRDAIVEQLRRHGILGY